MNKKTKVISIIVISVMFVSLLLFLPHKRTVKCVDLRQELDYIDRYPDNNCISYGCNIVDAETARLFGSMVINNMCGVNGISINTINVSYDSNNRLWLVQKTYILPYSNGGYVIIDQDSGRILLALMYK